MVNQIGVGEVFSDPNEIPLKIDFLLIDEFSMMAFSSAIEPLRLANRVRGKQIYEWELISIDGDTVTASNGTEIVVNKSIETAKNLKTVFLVSGINVHLHENERVFSFLRKISRTGAIIGALCTGSYLLAKAGLLNQHRCTIHWENLGAFRESFPEIEVSAEIYEFDKNRITLSLIHI